MLDFSSSLYLGMHHSSGELRDWNRLTTGAPAAFFEPLAAIKLGRSIASLQGLADGVVAPSTLHLFWDWFGGLNPRKDVIFADAQLYQVASWGVERAAGKGVITTKFRHQSATSLMRLISQNLGSRQRPIVVVDGWCPFCAKASPLYDYLQIIEAFNGLLVIDDTQALGILGKNPDVRMPYGYGGGGLIKHLNLKSDRLITISSLAKAFGAPLAALCGSVGEIKEFKSRSETRIGSSAPSAAALEAGKNALRLNTAFGDKWRARLLQNIIFFKECFETRADVELRGGFFPVQTIANLDQKKVRYLYEKFLAKGLITVPVLVHKKSSRLCYLLNVQHSEQEIKRACNLFVSTLRVQPPFLLKSYNYEKLARRNFITGSFG